jgi:hypothetical protein
MHTHNHQDAYEEHAPAASIAAAWGGEGVVGGWCGDKGETDETSDLWQVCTQPNTQHSRESEREGERGRERELTPEKSHQVAQLLRKNWHPFIHALSCLSLSPSRHPILMPHAETHLEAFLLRDVLVSIHLSSARGGGVGAKQWRRENAAVRIQRAVREWQYVFVDGGVTIVSESARLSYPMIPHEALIRISVPCVNGSGGASSNQRVSLGRYLIAPSSFDEIVKRGWVREGMDEEGPGLGDRDALNGVVRKGRLVPATQDGGGVVAWEEIRMSTTCSEGGVFNVQRNGDSSVTLRAVSGLPISSRGGGYVQRRIYLEYDTEHALFRIRSGRYYLCIGDEADDNVHMKEVFVHDASLWCIQVVSRTALGVPCKEFVGVLSGNRIEAVGGKKAASVAGGGAMPGREVVVPKYEGLEWPGRLVLRGHLRSVVAANVASNKVILCDGDAMLSSLPAAHYVVFTLARSPLLPQALNVFSLLVQGDFSARSL